MSVKIKVVLSNRIKRKSQTSRSGQSLMEILVAIGIVAALLGGVVTTYIVSLTSNANVRISSIATQLAQEEYDNLKAIAEANWNDVYDLTNGSEYYLKLVDGNFVPTSGSYQITENDVIYTRSFVISEVNRSNEGDIVTGAGEIDPSTKKVVVTVIWSVRKEAEQRTKISGYISRNRNISHRTTNWQDGPESEGPFIGQSSEFSNEYNVDYSTVPGIIKILSF